MSHMGTLGAFYAPWSAALAAVSIGGVEAPAHLGEVIMLDLGGVQFPLITGLLAVGGVLIARPLAWQREKSHGFASMVLVTVIMLVIALAWVAEQRPGILFAFVVSIGLGFSGYSLIELAGEEVRGFVRRIFQGAFETIARISNRERK